jgi:hypothetical protein
MQCCPLRSAVRKHRESHNGDGHRRLMQKLYAAVIGAAWRLDCFGLEQLLSAIPDSNEDFVHF